MCSACPSEIPISRQQAKIIGIAYYFTGKPCVHGHVAWRRVQDKWCIPCSREQSKRRYRENPGHLKSVYASWPIEKKRAKRKRIYWADPEAARSKALAWGKANPDKVKCQSHRKKSRRLAAGGDYTVEDVAAIRKMQRGRCAYCREKLVSGKTHIDHIIALARGGSNDRNNIQLACADCNLSKKAKDPIEFSQSLGRLI